MPSKQLLDTRGKVFPGAEQRFREAFERLKSGCPELLPPGSLVSQNNVALEAGCTPSALRKERFPTLVSDIQRHLAKGSGADADAAQAKYESALARITAVSAERDAAQLRYEKAVSEALDLLVELAELKRIVASYTRNPPIPFRSST